LGGEIYTFDQNLSIIEAIAVRNGMVIARGTNEEINELIGENTRVNPLDGKMMIPAFHDAHAHPIWSGIDQLKCPVFNLPSIPAIQKAVTECLNSNMTKSTGWVVGAGYNLGLFPAGNADKSLLDAVSLEIPIYLDGEDGHSGWTNSKALELAGISADTPNPELGIIEKDPVTGEPTGTLREPAAISLIKKIIPGDDLELFDDGLLFAQDLAHSFGITSIIAASVGEQHLAAYKRLADQGGLDLRMTTSIEYGNTGFTLGPGGFEEVFSKRQQYQHPRINVDNIKIFIDGVLEGQTAALLSPYLNTGSIGELNIQQAELDEAVTRFDREGIQVHMHAIGDQGVRTGLNAFEAALVVNGPTDNRHHIAHLQLISEADIPRFAELKVIANFQPVWGYPELYITEINLPEVGPERVNRMYPIASVHRAGGMVVGGSDWAVSTMNPLVAIETAIRREDPENLIKGVLNEDERMNLTEMLKAYTINSAYLMHQEHLTGSIEVGKAADLIILEKNLYTIPVDEISEVKVLQTMIEGKTVYTAN
jgi:predicted amidohydrolase YtcJ